MTTENNIRGAESHLSLKLPWMQLSQCLAIQNDLIITTLRDPLLLIVCIHTNVVFFEGLLS